MTPESALASPFGHVAPYEPASGFLKNPHFQMIVSEWSLRRRAPAVVGTTVELVLGDGATTRLLVVDPPGRPRGALLLVHGLGGAADSPNMRGIAQAAVGRGWRAVSVDMRGAGGSRPQPRLYTAADLDELDLAARHPAVAEAPGPKIAVGLSLGGGILLRWLGIRGADVPVEAAVALAPTGHLPSCAEALGRLRHRVYDWVFARSLGRRIRSVASASGRRSHGYVKHFTMRRLDSDFASLACGQPDAEGYWEHASAHHHVAGIARPVLIIAAGDDPFVPVEPLRRHFGSVPRVDLRVFPHGGHLSFIDRVDGRLRSRLPDLMLSPLEPLAPRS
jgi:predicted alpha/beta-fold hydrolase